MVSVLHDNDDDHDSNVIGDDDDDNVDGDGDGDDDGDGPSDESDWRICHHNDGKLGKNIWMGNSWNNEYKHLNSWRL